MKLDINQMTQLNKMVKEFKDNTKIDLDIDKILTDLGTRLESKQDFKEAYFAVYKAALNDQVVPGVMKSLRNGNVINHAGTHLDNVMEVLWDSLAPEKYVKEDEEYSKSFSEKKTDFSHAKKQGNKEIQKLGKMIDEVEEKLEDEKDEEKKQQLEKELNKLNKQLRQKTIELDKMAKSGENLKSDNTLFAHMTKHEYNDMVKEAFRNNVHLAGELEPTYKIIARDNKRDLTINKALIDSSFINANHAVTWDEYSADDFHSLIGSLSESYMIMREKYKNLGFFKKWFSNEGRELRGQIGNCIGGLTDLQDRMIAKGIIKPENSFNIKRELKLGAENIKDLPDAAKADVEKLFNDFATKATPKDIDKKSNKIEKEAPKNQIEKDEVKKIEIKELAEDKNIIQNKNENINEEQIEIQNEKEDLFNGF